MKSQFHINKNDDKKTIIELCNDEAINIHINSNPGESINSPPSNPTLNITGMRWSEESYHLLDWGKQELKLGDIVTISYLESAQSVTSLLKDELYIEPEKECSFCLKKASDVELLIESKLMSRICNDCVSTCQNVISEKRNQDQPG